MHTQVAAAVQPVIEVSGLEKAFGSKVLLRGAGLRVWPGETLAIIGESGSGKSVLLKIVMGLLEPDGGQVLFKGEDVVRMDQAGLDRVHRQVGYVFQADALFDSMTVLDNVGYALREHTDMSPEAIRARATVCLESVGLDAWRLDQHPSELSGGQRKRVGIARAVAIEPEILLYDEPTQGLDPQSITLIGKLIADLQRQLKATSVIVTHDMRTAFTVANRVALLHEGRFDHVGTPAELAHSKVEAVQEFIADALEELRDLPQLREAPQGENPG